MHFKSLLAPVHLHLTFSGLVCILSLKGRQEQCPSTTRLRVLKLDTRQSRLLNTLSKVLDEPVASCPACHLESRSNVGLEVPARQDNEFLWFPGQVEGGEGLVCNRQVIPGCNDHEQRSGADPLNVCPRLILHQHLYGPHSDLILPCRCPGLARLGEPLIGIGCR